MNMRLLLTMAFFFSTTALAGASTPSFRVLEVEDGDTLLVEMNGKHKRIQLLGIDAPENSDNPKLALDIKRTGLDKDKLLQLGIAAADHLKKLAPVGSNVGIRGDLSRTDRYGRISAVVINASGRSLAEAMVQDGYAIPLEQWTGNDEAYMRRLDRLERLSRKSQNGLWGKHGNIMRDWYDRTRQAD